MALLSRGQLPLRAQERLTGLLGAPDSAPIFSGACAPAGISLLRQQKFEPVGFVAGSAVYHVGLLTAPSGSGEVTALSGAYKAATNVALERLVQEARALKAHGVAGVRYSAVGYEWGEQTVEVQLTGTAVRGPVAPRGGRPWTSMMPVSEWWALRQSGYDPRGIVFGHCCWFVRTTDADRKKEASGRNVEVWHWSHALSAARKRAQNGLTEMVRQRKAEGVVGVLVERRLEGVDLKESGRRIEYRAGDDATTAEHRLLRLPLTGTAVSARHGQPPTPSTMTLAVSLREERPNVRS